MADQRELAGALARRPAKFDIDDGNLPAWRAGYDRSDDRRSASMSACSESASTTTSRSWHRSSRSCGRGFWGRCGCCPGGNPSWSRSNTS